MSPELSSFGQKTENEAEMRQLFAGISVLIFTLLICLSSIEAEQDLPWKGLIQSPNEKERRRGEKMVLEQYEKTISSLMSVVNRPVRKGEQFIIRNTSRNLAIYLLGKLRAKRAVPVLVTWLVSRPGQGHVHGRAYRYSPAADALGEIGLPAIPELLKNIKEKYKSWLGRACMIFLVAILGTEEAALVLNRELHSEQDQTKKVKIETALNFVKSKKPSGPDTVDFDNPWAWGNIEEKKPGDWKTLILHDDDFRKGKEKDRFKDRRQAAQMVYEERIETVNALMSIVRRPVKKGEPFYDPNTSRNIAIRLLGKLRAKEVADELVNWLLPKQTQSVVVDQQTEHSPAGCALAEIGLPALSPLVNKIKQQGFNTLGQRCLETVVEIKGCEGAYLVLKREKNAEKGPEKGQNLQQALQYLEKLKACQNQREYEEDEGQPKTLEEPTPQEVEQPKKELEKKSAPVQQPTLEPVTEPGIEQHSRTEVKERSRRKQPKLDSEVALGEEGVRTEKRADWLTLLALITVVVLTGVVIFLLLRRKK